MSNMIYRQHYKLLLTAGVALGILASSPTFAASDDEIPQIILEPLADYSDEPEPAPFVPEDTVFDSGEPIQLYDGAIDFEEDLAPVSPPEKLAEQPNETDLKAVALPDPDLAPAVRPQAQLPDQEDVVVEIKANTDTGVVPEDVEVTATLPLEVKQAPADALTPDLGELIDFNDTLEPEPQPEQPEPFYAGQLPVNDVATSAPVPDVFYDSDDVAPAGEMAKRGAITKLDPVKSPASRFVIVDKGKKADTTEARLVAASRAMKLGRYDSALEIYDVLYRENSRDPRILMGRAVALQHLDRFDESMSVYEEFSAIKPDDVEARINMLGLLATRFPAVATQRLKALHEEYPESTGVLAQLAIAEGKQGNYEGAMRYLGVAASMQPRNANHVYNMAVVADRAGNRKQAVAFYEQALELDTMYGQGQTIPRQNIYERLAAIR